MRFKNLLLKIHSSSERILSKLLPELYRNDLNHIKFVRLLSLQINSILQNAVSDIERTNIFERKWDNLIILDGCRYDVYERAVRDRTDIGSQNLDSIYSVGSASPEFISRSFFDGPYHDTIYVSANPFVTDVPENTFYAVYNLLGEDEYWDVDMKTVLPQTVTDVARDVAQEHPHKRLIIHYMQPHHPFLGDSAASVEYNRGVYGQREKGYTKDPWDDAYSKLRPDHELLYKAYRETLDIALESVVSLLDDLTGKTVISADHANLIGDRGFPIPVRGYGHPPGITSVPLLHVPWHEFDADSTKTIRADDAISDTQVDAGKIDQRLQYLGYK